MLFMLCTTACMYGSHYDLWEKERLLHIIMLLPRVLQHLSMQVTSFITFCISGLFSENPKGMPKGTW